MPSISSASRLIGAVAGNRDGAIAIIAAFAIPVVVGGLALASETGYWYMKHRKLQHAADLAAYAGTVRLVQQIDKSELTEESLRDIESVARASGFEGPKEGLIINLPPKKAGFEKELTSVEVILVDQVPRYFSSLFLLGKVSLSAAAIARYVAEHDSRACVLSLSLSASPAFSTTGSSTLQLKGCDIASNSVATGGMRISSPTQARCVISAGGVSVEAGLEAGFSVVDGEACIRTNARHVPDPFDGLSDLNLSSACRMNVGGGVTAESITNACGSAQLIAFNGSAAISFKDDVTVSNRIFVIDRTMNLTPAASATLTAMNTTFYFTAGGDMSTVSRLRVSAPTSGPTAGVALYFDSPSSVNLTGNSASSITGAVYAPKADLKVVGTAFAQTGCTQLVAGTVEISGASSMSGQCSELGYQDITTSYSIGLLD